MPGLLIWAALAAVLAGSAALAWYTGLAADVLAYGRQWYGGRREGLVIAGRATKRRVIGNPETYGARIMRALALLFFVVTVAGLWFITTKDINPNRSSIGFVRVFLGAATSTWAYLVVEIIALRSLLYVSNRRKASQSASYLGYETDEILRLSAEAKTTTDTTRVISTTEDTIQKLGDRIWNALHDADDDIIRPVSRETPHDADSGDSPIDGTDTPQIEQLERLQSKQGEIDTLVADAGDPEDLTPREATALLERIEEKEDEYNALVDDYEEIRRLSNPGPELRQGAENAERLAAELEPHGYEPQTESEDDAGEELPWSARFKIWRMDTAASLSTGDIVWQAIAPAAGIYALGLLAVQFWVAWWVYPVIGSVGGLVGLVNYYRIQRQRETQLAKLKGSSGREPWDALAIHVKKIRVGDSTMCYGWLAGNGFAHPDPEEFSKALAQRAHERVNGHEPTPTFLRKQFRNTRDMYPSIHGYINNVEKYNIAQELRSRVRNAPNGIIPKAKLIEDAVLHDIDYKYWGMQRVGLGYDPELVASVYTDLVPVELVEETMHITDVETGEDREITSVRLREESLPLDASEIRAQFASRYRAYSEFEPLFPVPEIPEERLSAHPQTIDV